MTAETDRRRRQLDALDAHFAAGGSLTVAEAIGAFGCYMGFESISDYNTWRAQK
jgi:hypothetical protein